MSYAPLVRCARASAGTQQGTGGSKIGNAHLTCPQAKAWLAPREKKRGKARALEALAARLGRAVYHLLRKKEAFDVQRLFA